MSQTKTAAGQTGQVISAAIIFGNPVSEDDLGAVSKGCFTVSKRISIDSLYPRQTELQRDTLELKMKGQYLTRAYVVVFNGRHILIDGHHTTAAKKIKGQRFVNALCYIIN